MVLISSMMPPIVRQSKPTQPATPSQLAQGNLRFSGDAYMIRQELKLEAEKEAHFKKIGDTVVWQRDNDSLNVAEMLAYLCRIRRDEGYPGYGTVEGLAKDFPGMDVEALREGFDKLHEEPYYFLGKDAYGQYWLRSDGEEMIKKLYPDVTLPSKKKRLMFVHLGKRGFLQI
jgi:hypothetical protein